MATAMAGRKIRWPQTTSLGHVTMAHDAYVCLPSPCGLPSGRALAPHWAGSAGLQQVGTLPLLLIIPYRTL